MKNPVYTGKIVHYENIYDGKHKAIIDQALFDQVQAITKSNCHDAMLGKRSANPSLLTGMLVDPDGKAMSPVHARKKVRRYRYYATRVDLVEPAGSAWRTSAGLIEKIVVEQTAQALENPDLGTSDDADLQSQVDNAQRLATKLRSSGNIIQRGILLDLNTKISIAENELKLSFECPTTGALQDHDIDAQLLRRGNNIRILQGHSKAAADNSADAGLLELIAKAFAARQHLFEAESNSLVANFSKRHLVRLARLSCLSPDIIDAILSGRQPATMTARTLLRVGTLPLCWAEQKAQLGFA